MTHFEKDLFISYSHIDNEPLTPGQKGWVTRFHKSLETLLNMRMGGVSKIWRDDKLTGDDVFSAEIVDQFSQTAVMVSVLSPRYIESDWCTKEMREFCEKAKLSGGVVVHNKARVYKVVKTPFESYDPLPKVVRTVLGYDFFITDDKGYPVELDVAFDEKFAQDYNRKVNQLAWDIARFLKTLKTKAVDGGIEETNGKPVVYLAECSYDRTQEREMLECELKHIGYKVIPEKELPRGEAAYLTEVEKLLESSNLSIHLVGNIFGSVPNGPSQKSLPLLQNELAVERSKSGGLVRIIWLPDGTSSEQPQQQAFLDLLHNNADAQTGADLINGDLEALKSAVRATLTKLEEQMSKAESEEAQDMPGTAAPLVYLICDEKDRSETIPIRKFLKNKGLDVDIPIFQGDATEIREAHQELLKTCNAVILFYGAGDEAWKRSIDNDIKKMPAYRSKKELPPIFTFLADPETAEKDEMIAMTERNLINGLAGFSESAMSDFVGVVKPDGGSA